MQDNLKLIRGKTIQNKESFLIPGVIFYLLMALMLLLKHNIYDLISIQYFAITIFILIFSIIVICQITEFKIQITDILVFVLMCYITVHSIICNVSVDNILKNIFIALVYFVTRVYFIRYRDALLILFPFLLVGLIESVLFLFQWVQKLNYSDLFVPAGTFCNVSRLSGYLTLITPILIIGFKSKHHFWRYASISIFLLYNVVVLLSLSRAAIIGLLGAYIFIFVKIFNIRLSVKQIALCGIIGVLLVVIMTLIKFDSAFGRLLIWKITLTKLYPYFLFGKGIDSFTALYNEAQSQYFGEKLIFDAESMCAGFVAYPYNEILNLLVELGLIPCLLITFILYRTVFTHNSESIHIRVSLFAIIIYSMFAYTTKVFPLVLIVFMYIAIVESQNQSVICKTLPLRFTGRSIVVVILLLLCLFQGYSLIVFLKIQKADLAYQTGKINDALNRYEKYVNRYNKSPIIMYRYGQILYDVANIDRAISVLDKVERQMPDPKILVLEARAHIKLNNFECAEKLLLKAADMVPNRFEAKYWLFKLYETNDAKKAESMARLIISQPVKIQSAYIDNIKKEMQAFLTNKYLLQ